MNQIQLTGRMATDVELAYLPTGVPVANFRVAVKNPWKKNAEGKAGADFFDVRAWRQAAEFAANYLPKGRDVAIAGRLEQQSWEKDGKTHYKIIIVANDVEGVGPNPNGAAPAPPPAAPAPPPAPAAAPVAATPPAPTAGAAPPPAEAFFDPFADDV